MLLVLLSLIAVSCNIDSSEGLFQEAGQSVKKESYTISKVLHKIDDDNYLVASNEGFFVFNGKDSSRAADPVSTGNKAKYALCATADSTTEWKAYYYDESDSKYYYVDPNGDSHLLGNDDVEYIDGSKYKLKSSNIFKDNNFDKDYAAVVFTNTETSKCSIYYGLVENLVSKTVEFKDTEYSDVSYIGENTFIGVKDGKLYYFKYSGSEITDVKENTNKYNSAVGVYYVNKTGSIYYNDESKKSTSLKTGTMQVMYQDGTSYYFLLNGAKEVYVGDGSGEITTTSISGLSNISVVAVTKVVDSKYINVITSESGAVSVNIEDKTVDSSWH